MNKKILLGTVGTLVLAGGVRFGVSQYQTNNEAKFDTQSYVGAGIKTSSDVDAIGGASKCENSCLSSYRQCLLGAGSDEARQEDIDTCNSAFRLCIKGCERSSTSDRHRN